MLVEHLEHPARQHAHRRVRRVGQGDGADSPAGEPAHVRSVARQSAGVADDVAETLVVDDVQPEPVAATVDSLGCVVEPFASRRAVGDGGGLLDLLKLPPRRTLQRPGVVTIAGGKGVVEKAHHADHVVDRRPQTAHRRQATVAEGPTVGHRPVVLHAVRPSPVLVVRRGPRRALEGQRSDQQAVGQVLRSLTGDPLDDSADHPVTQVGVVESDAGRSGEHRPGSDQGVELVGADVEVTVSPWIVGRQTRLHRQQVAQRDRGCVGSRSSRREFGDGIVEGQDAVIT